MNPWTLVGWLVAAAIIIDGIAYGVTAIWVVRKMRRMSREIDEADRRFEETRADIERGARPSGPRFKL